MTGFSDDPIIDSNIIMIMASRRVCHRLIWEQIKVITVITWEGFFYDSQGFYEEFVVRRTANR